MSRRVVLAVDFLFRNELRRFLGLPFVNSYAGDTSGRPAKASLPETRIL
jgi:hypothetical protein